LATALAAQDKAEALPLMQKLHDAHPDDPAISRMLAAVLADAGDYSGSDHYYIKLLAAKPNDPELLVSARARISSTCFATPTPTRCSTRHPSLTRPMPTAWSGLAFAASRTGHPDDHPARPYDALQIPS
jgi:predicted Zn-dependent protease